MSVCNSVCIKLSVYVYVYKMYAYLFLFLLIRLTVIFSLLCLRLYIFTSLTGKELVNSLLEFNLDFYFHVWFSFLFFFKQANP